MPVKKPKVRDGAVVLEIDDGAIVLDPVWGRVTHLNAEATLVFGLCDGTASMRQTATEIANGFNLDVVEVERQVRALVRDFERGGLLVPSRRHQDEDDDQRERIRMDVPRSS